MSAPLQLALGGLAEHRNHYLFSDHYLDHLLPDDPRWIAALPEARALGEWLRELYARERRQLVRYNGGLFDPELHPFLAGHAVGDRALAEAIDLLSRRKTKGAGRATRPSPPWRCASRAASAGCRRLRKPQTCAPPTAAPRARFT